MPTIEQVHRWGEQIELVATRIGGRFPRREQRSHAAGHLQGLISRVE